MGIGETRGTEAAKAEEQSPGANRNSVHRHHRRTEAPWRYGARSVGGARDQRSFGVTRRFSLAKPEGEQTGATRGDSSAGAGRCRFWGNPEPGRRRYRRIAYGATRKRSIGTAEASEPRLASRIGRRWSRKVQRAGQPAASIGRRSRKCEGPGQLGALQPAALKDARFESPRKSVAGNSQRIVLRG